MPTHRAMLITGGARRVGLAVARAMHARGWRVAFTYNTSEDAARLACEQMPGSVAIQADFSDESAPQRVAQATLDALGGVTLLINNASIYCADDSTDDSPEDSPDASRIMRVNHHAPVALIEATRDALNAAGGCVINLLDILAERPMPRYSAYCASKAALWNATLAYARTLAPRVRVNGIAPGVVDWPDDLPEPQRQAYLRRVPLARAGTPDDVAQAVRYLAEDAHYVTGQILRVDGGRSIT
jgi:pteridine reductase